VYPREVEEVLLTHPDVAEVAVLGVPDDKWGEVGVAVVVASRPGLTGEALLAHLEGRCAKYRWPRQFYFWDALPKSGYGKVTKKDIRARLVERGELQPFRLG
jgi:fatty-acyl-CoA synthase